MPVSAALIEDACDGDLALSRSRALAPRPAHAPKPENQRPTRRKALEMTTAMVNARELAALLKRVKTFADNHKDCSPALNTVHLFEHGGVLYAEATDRYRILVRKCVAGVGQAMTVDEGFDALVSVRDVQDIIQLTAKTDKTEPAVLTISDGGLLLKVYEREAKFALANYDYPATRRLFSFTLAPLDEVTVNSKFLADTNMPGRKQPTVLIAFVNEGKQVLFAADEYEIGLLMPIHRYTEDNTFEKITAEWSWLSN